MASISEREHREIETANASGSTPVVFIHGLWLLPGGPATSDGSELFASPAFAKDKLGQIKGPRIRGRTVARPR